jgi:integrase
MAAKVKWYRGAWWVDVHDHGKRKKKRIGATAAHKRQAEEIAKKLNAGLVLGAMGLGRPEAPSLPCRAELRRWHATYSPTFTRSFETESSRVIEGHLIPYFGGHDLAQIREEDLLQYIRTKLDSGLAPRTIETHLSILRRVLSLAVRDGRVPRNPAARLGELMRRVGRRTASEVATVDAWTREEVEALLALAHQHEPRFAPALEFLFSTGVRRGELLGLKWEDIDFENRRIQIRRAYVRDQMTTPKSGRARRVAMSARLGSLLLDVLAARRVEALRRGWAGCRIWSSRARPVDPWRPGTSSGHGSGCAAALESTASGPSSCIAPGTRGPAWPWQRGSPSVGWRTSWGTRRRC